MGVSTALVAAAASEDTDMLGAGIALLAAAVSAAFALWAAFQARRTEQLGRTAATTQLLVTVNQAFVEHPNVRPYFMDGLALAAAGRDSDLQNAVIATAGLFLNVLEAIASETESMSDDEQDAWHTYLHDLFAENLAPELRRRYEARTAWYPNLGQNLKLAKAIA